MVLDPKELLCPCVPELHFKVGLGTGTRDVELDDSQLVHVPVFVIELDHGEKTSGARNASSQRRLKRRGLLPNCKLSGHLF